MTITEQTPIGTPVYVDCRGCGTGCSTQKEYRWTIVEHRARGRDVRIKREREGGRSDVVFTCPTGQVHLAQTLRVVGNELILEEM